MDKNVTLSSHGVPQKNTEMVEKGSHMPQNQTFSTQFYKLAYESSVLGVNRFGDRARSWPRRLMWLLMWLIMLAGLLKVIIDGTLKYLSYPYTVHVTYENIHNHSFPDVTICNNNFLRKSLLQNGSQAKLFFETVDMTHPDEHLANPDIFQWAMNTEFIATFLKGAIPPKEFVSRCENGLFPTQCPNMTQVITNRGVCYTLSGFVNNEGQPTINKLPGMDFGFKFIVDIQTHEDSKMRISDGIGIIVMVHPTGTPPNINTAFAVAPGTEQYVALQITQTSRLGLPYSAACRPEKGFSQEQCRLDCMSRHVRDHCGCDMFGSMPSVKNCSVIQFSTCWGSAYDAVYRDDEEEYCSCLLPCEQTVFNVETSNMKYPSDISVKDITAHTGHSKEYLEKNIIAINLYFQSFVAQKVFEEPSYGLSEFAADAGGQMGLFLGASIISISEFLEFLFDIFLMIVNRRNTISTVARNK